MSEPVVDESSAAVPPNRKGLTITLAVVFTLSIVLGTGPGVLLVNRPEAIAGVPLVYAWGILWYVVQVVVVLIAYFTIWNRPTDEADNGDAANGLCDASPTGDDHGGAA